MKTISLRAFQLHPTDYIKDLPITLTRYGKAICIVSSVNTILTPHIKPKEKTYYIPTPPIEAELLRKPVVKSIPLHSSINNKDSIPFD
jgi:hypothetical protein